MYSCGPSCWGECGRESAPCGMCRGPAGVCGSVRLAGLILESLEWTLEVMVTCQCARFWPLADCSHSVSQSMSWSTLSLKMTSKDSSYNGARLIGTSAKKALKTRGAQHGPNRHRPGLGTPGATHHATGCFSRHLLGLLQVHLQARLTGWRSEKVADAH